MTNRFPLSAALIAALLTSTTALADGWSNLGGFDPDEAAQIRQQLTKPASAQQGDWNQFGTSDDWVALDKFERGTPGKNPPRLASFRLPKGTKVDQLYALIEFAESPKAGYDAIHHSARKLTTKRPTQMTLGEIKSWIRATPGQHHAIGRFQVIPSTFANLQKRLRLPDSAVFNRATQDKMAGVLLSDAGYHDFIAGDLTLSRFMDNLALIWAGFPMAHGKSNYHGYAGNRATVTRAFFEKQMTTIFVRNAVPDGDDQAQPERVAKASTARPATPGEDR